MDIEIFTLCDFAEDMGGKLFITGTFDTLFARSLPLTHPTCSLVLRARFSGEEAGKHHVEIHFVDQDGKSMLPTSIQCDVQVQIPPGRTHSSVNLVVNIGQLKIAVPGKYSIDLVVDGRHERSLPLYVAQVEAPPR